ncbi:MmpS family transport accessory protein [Mycolicibacterium phlei]
MSGPNPPDDEASLPGQEPDPAPAGEPAPDAGETEIYSRAYSAPESEQFTAGPYVPPDASLYEYDDYDQADAEPVAPPKWPWVVGVAAIIAAIALVASVSILVTRTETSSLATPQTSTTTTTVVPPVQDEITTTTAEPPPPPPLTSEEPPPPPPETVTVTQEAPPPPPPAPEPPPAEEPAPAPETSEPPSTPPPPTTTRSGPRQVTYSVTGTKAPGDIITVTYIDASGRSRTQRNVYIPWSLTVTPISQSEIGSVQASSLFLVSRLNCSITTSDGTVLSSNTNNAAQISC